MRDCELRIRGMDCAEEVDALKREVGPLVGGESHLVFDILRGKMTVKASAVAVPDIIQAVNNTGMRRAEPWVEKPAGKSASDSAHWFRNGRTIATVVSGVMTLAGFLAHAILIGGFAEALGSEGLGQAHHVPLVSRLIYLVAIMASGRYVAPKALFALRRLRPDMNLLMTIAVIGAVILGEWLEGALPSSGSQVRPA